MIPAAEQLAKARRAAQRDALVMAMLQQLRAAGLDVFMVRELVFHPTRKWRFDLAWEPTKVAVEIDGGTYTGGRHTRGKGYENDCEKLNEALVLGWRVLRVTSHHIGTGQALQWIERMVKR